VDLLEFNAAKCCVDEEVYHKILFDKLLTKNSNIDKLGVLVAFYLHPLFKSKLWKCA